MLSSQRQTQTHHTHTHQAHTIAQTQVQILRHTVDNAVMNSETDTDTDIPNTKTQIRRHISDKAPPGFSGNAVKSGTDIVNCPTR